VSTRLSTFPSRCLRLRGDDVFYAPGAWLLAGAGTYALVVSRRGGSLRLYFVSNRIKFLSLYSASCLSSSCDITRTAVSSCLANLARIIQNEAV
jgi:hypothetical protein